MKFSIEKSIEILERTPSVLESMLTGLSEDWIHQNEGGDSWNAFDIVGHLIHGEKTDWIPRMEIMLSERENKTFAPFNRFAQLNDSIGKTLPQLLVEFKALRKTNITRLKNAKLNHDLLSREGMHPALGKVNLQQLLATWTVHDLGHIAQIARVMAKHYRDETGVWQEYLPVLHK